MRDGKTNQGGGVLHLAHILGCGVRQVNATRQVAG
jgi:hypothetical protein